jgi:hypothetical protein
MKIEKGYPLKTQADGLPDRTIYFYIDKETLSSSFSVINERNIKVLGLAVAGRMNIVERLIFRENELWELLKEDEKTIGRVK